MILEDLTEWVQHPVVNMAARNLPDEATALDLLISLHEVLTDLDDRFPGVPFRKMIVDPDNGGATKLEILETLTAAGVSDDDIRAILSGGSTDYPTTEAVGMTPEVIELMDANLKPKQLRELGVHQTLITRIRGTRQPLTPDERLAARYIDLVGVSTIRELERATGLPRQKCQRVTWKVAYLRHHGLPVT